MIRIPAALSEKILPRSCFCGAKRQVAARLFSLVILEKLGELLFEGLDFGAVADQDVGVVGVVEGVVLMVGLGVVKALQWDNLGNDGLGEDVCGIKLSDVRLADFVLLVIRIKDGGAVRGA